MSIRSFGLRTAMRRLSDLLTRLARDESGSLSVELVIWIPLVVYMTIAMFTLSFYLATVSEVQQVAHELARASVSRMQTDETEAEICGALQNQILPRVVQTMTLLQATRFAPLSAADCSRDVNDFLTVEVTYQLANSPLSRLGRMIGLTLNDLRRKAMVQL